MTTITICMVKVMRLQKPSPNDVATAAADAPLISAAAATTATARADEDVGVREPAFGPVREPEPETRKRAFAAIVRPAFDRNGPRRRAQHC